VTPSLGWAADLDPSSPQARQWATDELAKPGYGDGRSLFERIMAWVGDLLDRLLNARGSDIGPGLPPFVIAIVVVLVLAGLVALLARVRGERHTVADPAAVLGGSALTASQFRARGAAALDDGRWGDAVVEYTRAIAREGADRTLLTDAPSLTAHEVGTQLSVSFPAHAPAVATAMDLFDAVRYGGYAATEPDARTVRAVEETLRTTRPVLLDGAASASTWGGP
jgi:hypothetical protein